MQRRGPKSSECGLVYIVQPTILLGSDYYKLGCSRDCNFDTLAKSETKSSRFIYVAECVYPYLLFEKLKERFANVFSTVKAKDIPDNVKHDIPIQENKRIIKYRMNRRNPETKMKQYIKYETPLVDLNIYDVVYGIPPDTDLYKADLIMIKKEFISVELDHSNILSKADDVKKVIINDMYEELFKLDEVKSIFLNYKEDIAYGGTKILISVTNGWQYSDKKNKVYYINNNKKLAVFEPNYFIDAGYLAYLVKNKFIKYEIVYDLLEFKDRKKFGSTKLIDVYKLDICGNYPKELTPEILNSKLYLIYKYLYCNIICGSSYGIRHNRNEVMLFNPVRWSSVMEYFVVDVINAKNIWQNYNHSVFMDKFLIKFYTPRKIYMMGDDYVLHYEADPNKYRSYRREYTSYKTLSLSKDSMFVISSSRPIKKIDTLISALNELFFSMSDGIWLNYNPNVKSLIDGLANMPGVKENIVRKPIIYKTANGDVLRDDRYLTGKTLPTVVYKAGDLNADVSVTNVKQTDPNNPTDVSATNIKKTLLGNLNIPQETVIDPNITNVQFIPDAVSDDSESDNE